MNRARPTPRPLHRCLKKPDLATRSWWKLDRLSRSLADLIQMLDDFNKRSVRFRFSFELSKPMSSVSASAVKDFRRTARRVTSCQL